MTTSPNGLNETPAERAARLAAEKARIEAEIAEVEAAANEERNANRASFLNTQIAAVRDTIAEFFGVADISAMTTEQKKNVAEFVADFSDGLRDEFPRVGGGRVGPRLSEAEMKERDEKIVELLKTPGSRVSDIAEKFGVSVGTVNIIKKEAGLTVPRPRVAPITVKPVNLGTPKH